MNAVEIEEAISSLAEQPFVAAEFPYSFLEAFGNKLTTITRLKAGNNNKSDVRGGVLQQNNIHIAVCGEGEVAATLEKLRQSPASAKLKAKFLLATDGKDFQAEDVNSGDTLACNYPDFHHQFGFFLPLAGISTVKQIRENAFDIKATSRLNKLYIELLRYNPEWAMAGRRHDMNHFLARLIFCFFAEDTNIFSGESLFTDTVQTMSASDAADTHEVIGEIFRAMDVKQGARAEKKVKQWACKFPYVNGNLFSGSIETPQFTRIARTYLFHVGSLDWKRINPDIFGSMIQAVADDSERGALGMHYTSVPNILKVLNPLFLDELNEELAEAGDNTRKLLNLRKRISRIRVFDPACGSGNFLVIAYKRLRELECEINTRRGERALPTQIPLTNFRGIEIRDFSAEVARLALIIAEYQCDVLYRGHALALAEFLPLNSENWITCGNALKVNWLSVCPPTSTDVAFYVEDLFSAPVGQAEIDFENEGGETYICGNPPYLGSKRLSDEQKGDLQAIFKDLGKDRESLDYVAGWFVKAAEYCKYSSAAVAFVSTNSICQGEQVASLWPLIFNTGCQIFFAHTSFKWANLASHNAGVTVVIVGFSKQTRLIKRIYSIGGGGETIEKRVENINAYLVAANYIIIKKVSRSLIGLPVMQLGNVPKDGGNLLLSTAEKNELNLSAEQEKRFLRRIYGSAEFIRGISRFVLWIEDEFLEEAMQSDSIRTRIEGVRLVRLASRDKGANEMANFSHQMREMNIGKYLTLVVPRVSSESREYLPVGLIKGGAAISDSAFGLFDAPIWCLSIIASKLHLTWIATVCGKLKTDFRYSNTMGWNTFPVPTLTQKNKDDLTVCAVNILIARERHFPATIAELYDPEIMPADLRQAHNHNDEILERIYIGRRFKNDTERLEKLFHLYTQMTTNKKAS